MIKKLNIKRTFIIGLAFFTILMMWQVYNNYCPLFLNNLLQKHFGEGNYDYIVGLIMAVDNVLGLFMLPLFGMLSDKTKSKLGKRMPYIIVGTLITSFVFPFIPFLFLKNNLVGVVVLMGIVLVSMNAYRNPAVALMPDVTPKPLRSKANAIINLVGYIGAIFAGLIAMFFKYDSNSIIIPFALTSVFMIGALVVLVLKIKENKLQEQLKDELLEGEKQSQALDDTQNQTLGKDNKKNLWLMVVSVFLWFFSFNAIETFWSTYSELYLNISMWSLGTIVMTISCMLSFLLGSFLTNKLGRKKVVMIGLITLISTMSLSFIVGELIPKNTTGIPFLFFVLIFLFLVSGIGWAFVNVNSYPMVVELSNKNNIGKFTGYYYTASMLAQSITPVAVGFVLAFIGYKMLFAYSAFFMALALLVFAFVKTKTNKKQEKKEKEN